MPIQSAETSTYEALLIGQCFDTRNIPGNESELDRLLGLELAGRPYPVGPEGYERRVRHATPHASIYAHFKALRAIASATACKPHDLYIEGLRMVLRQHGRDFDALKRGDA